MTEKTIHVYIANDGTAFWNKEQCLCYEQRMGSNEYLFKIYDKHNRKLDVNVSNFENLAAYIYVPDVTALRQLSKYLTEHNVNDRRVNPINPKCFFQSGFYYYGVAGYYYYRGKENMCEQSV